MNEKELAEKFGRELETAPGGGTAAAGADAGALETARKLARADFSGDSAIREELRAALLAREGRTTPLSALAAFFRRTAWLQVAAAAACLAVVMLPSTRRPREKPAAPVPAARPSVPERPAAAPPAAARARAVRRPAAPARAAAPEGLFTSVPFSAAPIRPRHFPIQTRGSAPLGRVTGRKIPVPGGSAIVWETEGAVFTLETRKVEPGELFEKRTM